jgi:hypothetical protein
VPNLPFGSVSCTGIEPSKAHLARVSSLSGPAQAGIRPVIHKPRPEGDGALPVVSRCLSAAGIRFSAILSRLVFRPSHDRPTGTDVPDHDGVSMFRTRELRPDWAPSVPRDQRCSHEPGQLPDPPPAASQRRGPVPRYHRHPPGARTHEASVKGSSSSPARPSPRPWPRMTRETLRLSPGLRTRAGRTRARTPGRGQALSTSPGLRRRLDPCRPSDLRAHSYRVRPHVASCAFSLPSVLLSRRLPGRLRWRRGCSARVIWVS